ncbi:MAG TPA: VTT domain-containing protein [Phycisphaeraceae bacterium]
MSRAADNTPSSARVTLVRWAAAAGIVIGLFLFLQALPIGEGLERLTRAIDALGVWGPLAFAGIYAVATVLMLPGSALTLAAGALFGLGWGVASASVGSTLGAAMAMLIGRYAARERVTRLAQQSPRFAAMDRAISRGGWRIVALLRLSPAVPFNLQNYFYGLTGIRFWPCVLTSWVAMLPGTFLYVYLGSLGRAAVEVQEATMSRMIFSLVGLAATVAVTVYLTRLARRELARQAALEATDSPANQREPARVEPASPANSHGRTVVLVLIAVLMLTAGVWAQLNRQALSRALARLGGPPRVTLAEHYDSQTSGDRFDHSRFDALLKQVVDDQGLVDYARLQQNAAELDAYLAELAQAPFEKLSRDEKLAMLINAYNAFTLRLILDHWPVESIRDIDQPWDGPRWNLGGRMLTLNQIEHEEIRGKFREPRIHFAVNCASIGCPPLRREAYVGSRIDEQLQDQALIVHRNGSRWFRFDPLSGRLELTKLYQWYGSDFEQVADTVVDYAAQFNPLLREAVEAGKPIEVVFLDYDWSLNASGGSADL